MAASAAPIHPARAVSDKPNRGWLGWSWVVWLWLTSSLLLAASLIGFWPAAHWSVRMITPFRFQYLVLACGLLAIGVRRPRAWVIRVFAAATIGVNVVVLWPWLAPNLEARPAETFRVMVWNTWGRHPNHAQVIQAIERSNADLVLACEIPEPWIDRAPPVIDGYDVFSQKQFLAAVKQGTKLEVAHRRVVWPPYGMQIDATWQGRPLRILDRHGARPTTKRSVAYQDYQYDALRRWFHESNLPTVIAGDFNQTPWCPGLADFIKEFSLRDASRGRGVRATFPADPPVLSRVFGVPIDHCLHTKQLAVARKWVGAANGSNHRPIFVEIGWREEE